MQLKAEAEAAKIKAEEKTNLVVEQERARRKIEDELLRLKSEEETRIQMEKEKTERLKAELDKKIQFEEEAATKIRQEEKARIAAEKRFMDEVASLKEALASREAELAASQNQVTKLNETMESKKTDLTNLQEALGDRDTKIDELKSIREKIEEDNAKRKAELAAKLKNEEEIRLEAANEISRLKAETEAARRRAEDEARRAAEKEAARAEAELELETMKKEELRRIRLEKEGLARLQAELEQRARAEKETAAKSRLEEEARIKARNNARLQCGQGAIMKAEEERIARFNAKGGIIGKVEEDKILLPRSSSKVSKTMGPEESLFGDKTDHAKYLADDDILLKNAEEERIRMHVMVARRQADDDLRRKCSEEDRSIVMKANESVSKPPLSPKKDKRNIVSSVHSGMVDVANSPSSLWSNPPPPPNSPPPSASRIRRHKITASNQVGPNLDQNRHVPDEITFSSEPVDANFDSVDINQAKRSIEEEVRRSKSDEEIMVFDRKIAPLNKEEKAPAQKSRWERGSISDNIGPEIADERNNGHVSEDSKLIANDGAVSLKTDEESEVSIKTKTGLNMDEEEGSGSVWEGISPAKAMSWEEEHLNGDEEWKKASSLIFGRESTFRSNRSKPASGRTNSEDVSKHITDDYSDAEQLEDDDEIEEQMGDSRNSERKKTVTFFHFIIYRALKKS